MDTITSTKRNINGKKIRCFVLVKFFLILIFLPVANSHAADDLRVYFGGSAGAARLSTEFSVEERAVSDDPVVSGSVFAGVDVTPRISLEASLMATDKADVKRSGVTVGDIGYRDIAFSALGYVYRAKSPSNSHEGFSVFSRLGAGYKDLNTRLASRDSDRAHLVLGLGTEYGWSNGVATRAEFSLLDDDAEHLNISLLKRFDRQEALVGRSTSNKDKGLWEERLFVSMPTIYFPDNDPRTPIIKTEQKRLDELARQLIKNPRLEIEVNGYSDASISVRDALIISRRRAFTAARYLQLKGVRGNRLHIRSYASSHPLPKSVLNTSTETRKISNRRVEFSIYEG